MSCLLLLSRSLADLLPPLSSRYVSRANPRDSSRHTILGTQWYKPREFASQMNISLANGWGIVRTIADLCFKQPEGKYVLLKDPNKVRCLLCFPCLSSFLYSPSESSTRPCPVVASLAGPRSRTSKPDCRLYSLFQQPVVRLYRVPYDAFETVEDVEEEIPLDAGSDGGL